MTTNHYTGALYTAPHDRPASHLRHIRRGYEVAGLDLPAYLSGAADEVLQSYAAEHEAEAKAALNDAALSDDPATDARRAVEAFSTAGAWRAAAERAAQAQTSARLASLPTVRERAAADYAETFSATVARLGELAAEFDPAATRSLDAGRLGDQRQYAGLKVLDEVQVALATLGALTLVPAPADPSRPAGGTRYGDVLYPGDLVVDVTYDEDSTAEPAPRLWITQSPAGPVRDEDVYVLAAAGDWLGDDAATVWRLYQG